MISDEKFQEIIDKTDIVSLVSEYVELTKKGNGYFGLCPFHNDSSPSFSVSSEKKIAKCMSCGEGGNPITFLKKVKNISFIEAATILAQRASIELDVSIKPKKEDKNKKYYDIYKVAQEFYSYNLFNSKSGKKALDYLYKRGLTEETIKMFGIGLAPNEKNTLTNVLIENGFLDLDCIEIGLIKNNGTTLYDMFTNRIMFPITNENGFTIAFSGRLYEESNGPKYVNTAETIIYRKGDHLYNLSNAIPSINKTKQLVLCEGQMDVIKVYNSNVKDVVCALGSALTSNQVKLIKKYATNVVLAYDNDAAGIKATITAINLLNGLNVDVLELPNGMDPDEYIEKNSVEEFVELFTKKTNSIEFIYKSYFKDKNIYSLSDVENIKKNVFSYIKQIKSNTIKEQLFNKLSADLKINYESLLKDFNGTGGIKKPVEYKEQYHPPMYDYIPDAPPEDFGSYQQDYSQTIDIKQENKNVYKIEKNVLEASKTLIALLIYDKENLSIVNETLEGSSVEEYLVSPYYEIYEHLIYLYDNYEMDKQEIWNDFQKECKHIVEFDEIIKLVNSFKSNTKFRKILVDSIKCIKESAIIRKIFEQYGECSNDIDAGNYSIEQRKEMEKIKNK